MKKFIGFFVFMVAFMLLSSSSCESTSVDRTQADQQEASLQELNRQVGMPNIVNFTEKKMMKDILELRDKANLICYAYIVPEMTGKPVFLGKCIGYGLPYATQFTNPERQLYQSVTLPQADPNGLFMPASADGTWILLINPATGEPKPVYCEPRVLISPFPL